jgi:hypothetical protein
MSEIMEINTTQSRETAEPTCTAFELDDQTQTAIKQGE